MFGTFPWRKLEFSISFKLSRSNSFQGSSSELSRDATRIQVDIFNITQNLLKNIQIFRQTDSFYLTEDALCCQIKSSFFLPMSRSWFLMTFAVVIYQIPFTILDLWRWNEGVFVNIRTPRIRFAYCFCGCCVTEKSRAHTLSNGFHNIRRLSHYPQANTLSRLQVIC